MNSYLVIGSKPWNKRLFYRELVKMPGEWYYIDATEYDDLNACILECAQEWNPRYIFFVHCSTIIKPAIYENYECVVFHPSDLPDGAGGTPIQNQIARGQVETKVSAFRMTGELDAGPIYVKQSLSLSGSLKEIFEREMFVISNMINWIIDEEIEPVEQTGYGEKFKRRIPTDSEIYNEKDIEQVYDAIRMMDAETYPKAFIKLKYFDLELFDAKLDRNDVLSVKMKVKRD